VEQEYSCPINDKRHVQSSAAECTVATISSMMLTPTSLINTGRRVLLPLGPQQEEDSKIEKKNQKYMEPG
jgi:hypothetical protein